jgi:hypothetical protein
MLPIRTVSHLAGALVTTSIFFSGTTSLIVYFFRGNLNVDEKRLNLIGQNNYVSHQAGGMSHNLHFFL